MVSRRGDQKPPTSHATLDSPRLTCFLSAHFGQRVDIKFRHASSTHGFAVTTLHFSTSSQTTSFSSFMCLNLTVFEKCTSIHETCLTTPHHHDSKQCTRSRDVHNLPSLNERGNKHVCKQTKFLMLEAVAREFVNSTAGSSNRFPVLLCLRNLSDIPSCVFRHVHPETPHSHLGKVDADRQRKSLQH